MRHFMRGLAGLLTCVFAACVVGVFSNGGAAEESKANDLVGSWKLKFVSSDGQTRESVLTLTREGTALKGNYTADSVTRMAKDLGYERGELTFRVDGEYLGKTYTLTYKGRPQGDVFRGAVRWKFGLVSGSFDFEGQRVTREVVANR